MIRNLISRVLPIAALIALSAAAIAQTAAPAQVFQLPAFQRVKLPNGMTLLLLEKHELPLVSIELALRSGSVTDPRGKEGLASMTAALLRKGTTTRNSEQVSSDLDFSGMQYNAQVGGDLLGVACCSSFA